MGGSSLQYYVSNVVMINEIHQSVSQSVSLSLSLSRPKLGFRFLFTKNAPSLGYNPLRNYLPIATQQVMANVGPVWDVLG